MSNHPEDNLVIPEPLSDVPSKLNSHLSRKRPRVPGSKARILPKRKKLVSHLADEMQREIYSYLDSNKLITPIPHKRAIDIYLKNDREKYGLNNKVSHFESIRSVHSSRTHPSWGVGKLFSFDDFGVWKPKVLKFTKPGPIPSRHKYTKDLPHNRKYLDWWNIYEGPEKK